MTVETRDRGFFVIASRDGSGAMCDVGLLERVLSETSPPVSCSSMFAMLQPSLVTTEDVSETIRLQREYLWDKFRRLKFGTTEAGLPTVLGPELVTGSEGTIDRAGALLIFGGP